MKPIQKISSAELAELKGGVSSSITSSDSTNLNTTAACRCYFYNTQLSTNTNTVEYCLCQCIGLSSTLRLLTI